MPDEFTLSTLIPAELNQQFEIECSRRNLKKKPAVAEALRCWIENTKSIAKTDNAEAPKKEGGELTTTGGGTPVESVAGLVQGEVQVPIAEEIPWVQRLLRVLRSAKPGLRDALRCNLVEFEWAAGAYDEFKRYGRRQGEALPAAANAPSELRSTPHPGEGDDEHPRGRSDDSVTDEDVDRAVARAKEAGKRREQGKVGHPRKDRKGRAV
jgi:hypothetical protein